MQLNGQQARALEKIVNWYHNSSEQVFYLAGYAGTGKTTLAKYATDYLNLDYVVFASYTGKAASVLSKKVHAPAYTLHQLMYMPRSELIDLLIVKLTIATDAWQAGPDKDGPPPEEVLLLREALKKAQENITFALREQSILSDVDLCVVDEISMLNKWHTRDLLSFGCRILVLGDPAQLPPVKGAGQFATMKPHVFLTQIMRQELNNPIIKWASMVRQGEEIPEIIKDGGFKRLLPKAATWKLYLGADQVLCGTNDLRRKLNLGMRKQLGYTKPYPQKGEKLICCRNNHTFGLLNGVLYTVASEPELVDPFNGRIYLDIELEDGKILKDAEVNLTRFQSYFEDTIEYFNPETFEFDWGYAITVHKAQGSEWDNVVLLNDWKWKDYNKWLYTGITRSRKKLTMLG